MSASSAVFLLVDDDERLRTGLARALAPAAEPSFETPSLARVEREHIERVLSECGGNVSRAARVLGMHRRTLQYKLAKFPVSR
ncbi:MAG TPA: helix-turn-helix domain-containing protein [Polyangiaceae bacterium]|nr:helix-turn-helix domain-containing protein [Polyangiaceae bacterium]